jgi:hypothetical protein
VWQTQLQNSPAGTTSAVSTICGGVGGDEEQYVAMKKTVNVAAVRPILVLLDIRVVSREGL